jgi:hypothetical protein
MWVFDPNPRTREDILDFLQDNAQDCLIVYSSLSTIGWEYESIGKVGLDFLEGVHF